MKQSKFPPGWDAERVKRVLAHYESQSGEEAVAEDEAAPAPPHPALSIDPGGGGEG